MRRAALVLAVALLAGPARRALADHHVAQPAPGEAVAAAVEEAHATEAGHEAGALPAEPAVDAAHGESVSVGDSHADTAHAEAAHADSARADDAAHGEGAHGEAAHGEGAHGGPNWAPLLTNFGIFVGVLALILAKPATAFLRERRAGIELALSAAERAQAEADARLKQAQAALAELDSKVEAMIRTASETAAAERERILQAARDDAARILAQAEAQVGDIERDAERRLRTLAADLAVDLARDLCRGSLSAEDRARLFDRYLKSLQKAAP